MFSNLLHSNYRRDRNTGSILSPNIDGCTNRDLFLFSCGRFCLRFLVLSEVAGLVVPGTLRATAATQSTNRKLGVARIQQQVHQSCAECAAQESKWQECEFVRGKQASAEGEENVHMIQKTTQSRLRLAAGPHGFWRIFHLLFLRPRGIGRAQRRGRRR